MISFVCEFCLTGLFPGWQGEGTEVFKTKDKIEFVMISKKVIIDHLESVLLKTQISETTMSTQ